MSSKNDKALLVALAILVVAGVSYLALINKIPREPEPEACTMDAKLCSDGSYVGRQGPSCEFALCPGEAESGVWKIFADTDTGISFSYPAQLPAKYISAPDWPPQVQLINEFFACAPAGSETARVSRTEKRTVDGREYCLTRMTDAALGSTYTQYAYAFPDNDNTVILTFSLRFLQCENYDAVEKAECQRERAAFNPDQIVDRIRQSVRFQ